MIGVNTNLTGGIYRSINNLGQINQGIYESLVRVETGNKILRASDNPSGLVTVLEMDSNINTAQTQLESNRETIAGLNGVDDALTSIIARLQDMKSLVTDWENAAAASQERTDIETAIQDISDIIDEIAADTEFNGEAVLAGGAGAKAIRWGSGSGDTFSVTFTDMRESQTDLNNSTTFALQLAADPDVIKTQIDAAITNATDMAGPIGRATDIYLQRQNDFLASNVATWGEHRDLLMQTDVVEESSRIARLEGMRQSALQALSVHNDLLRSTGVDLFA